MAIGSPPITWDPKHTGELWVHIGAAQPNPSGNTGVMVCDGVSSQNMNYILKQRAYCLSLSKLHQYKKKSIRLLFLISIPSEIHLRATTQP